MKRVLILLILFLVFISACSNGLPLGESGEGVDFSFKGVPDKLMNGMAFTVGVDLVNHMTRKMENNVEVCLGDIQPEECGMISIEAASVTEGRNGELVVSPQHKEIRFPLNHGEYYYNDLDYGPVTLFLSVGYPVDAVFSRNIYMLYDRTGNNEQSEYHQVTERGGLNDFTIKESVPVTINSFEKEIRPLSPASGGRKARARLKLVFSVAQQGDGILYYDSGQQEQDINYLFMDIGVKGYNNLNFNCGQDDLRRLKLSTGSKRVECYAETELLEEDPHQVNLNINLKYYYKVRKSATIPFEAQTLYQ